MTKQCFFCFCTDSFTSRPSCLHLLFKFGIHLLFNIGLGNREQYNIREHSCGTPVNCFIAHVLSLGEPVERKTNVYYIWALYPLSNIIILYRTQKCISKIIIDIDTRLLSKSICQGTATRGLEECSPRKMFRIYVNFRPAESTCKWHCNKKSNMKQSFRV